MTGRAAQPPTTRWRGPGASRSVVVGIAGGSGSGKTTVALALAARLGEDCLIVSHDRYYRSLPATADPLSYNFDCPDAIDSERLIEDLALLRAGQSARLPRYDMTTHQRVAPAGWEPVTPVPVILVEGILVLAVPPLSAVLDHRVFVDAPADIRLLRRLRRDVLHRGRRVESVLTQYERSVRPMHERYAAPSRDGSDLCLDGTADPPALVDEIMLRINAGLQTGP